MNRGTTIAGALAGLSFLAAALAQEVPLPAWLVWALRVLVGLALAVFGALARDSAPPPPQLPPSTPNP